MVVALLGYGTVGKKSYEIIRGLSKVRSISVKYILCRNKNKDIMDKSILTTDYSEILNDDEVEVIIEMMGSDISYDCIKRALLHSKNVITANKEVMALHLRELMDIAYSKGVEILFEAAVGGGIPIIHTIMNEARYNSFSKIDGILNGTTNYILTSMHEDKIDFKEALKNAQAMGFAEADPTSDLEGLDMVRKIQILSSLAYRRDIKLSGIFHLGISGINKDIISFIDLLGYKLKLMASSEYVDGDIRIFVMPTLVDSKSILANVMYEYNIISYTADVSGNQMMYGKGAGELTANSILYDISLINSNFHNKLRLLSDATTSGIDNVISKYLILPMDEIDENIIERHIGNMIITKEISGLELKKLLPKSEFVARFLL